MVEFWSILYVYDNVLAACCTRGSDRIRLTFFGKNLSQARNFVLKLDAATATSRTCHLHGRTQHTVASAPVHKSTSGANGAAIETRRKSQRCDALERRISTEGLQLIWSVSRRVAVIRQHSICMQHVFAAFCQPAAPRSALSLHHLLLHKLSGRRSRCVQQQL